MPEKRFPNELRKDFPSKRDILPLTLAGLPLIVALSFISKSCLTHQPQPKYPTEVLSDWQVERGREFTIRNRAFYRCDEDKNGILNEKENKNFLKEVSFKYRFR